MTNQRYVVKKGDTLWELAGKFLGSPEEWPRIYGYNNMPEVVRVTGGRIEDPDMIYAGQTLLLPICPDSPGRRRHRRRRCGTQNNRPG